MGGRGSRFSKTKRDYLSNLYKGDSTEFLKSSLNEMRGYEGNWNFMSRQAKDEVGVSIEELRERIKIVEKELRKRK